MFGSHSKLSIAQIVFYVPATVVAMYLACYRHKRPRMAWNILTFFSLIRITAGILVIIPEKTSSTDVVVASIIFLNAGVFPLIAATLGLIRIITALERTMSQYIRQCLLHSRILFFGSDTVSDVRIGIKLVKAGYIVVVVFVGCLLATQGYFWTQHSCLSGTSRTILRAMALATPFIIVRIAYLFLSVFQTWDSRWNDLKGPIGPFLGMGLVMEYVVVWIILYGHLPQPRLLEIHDPSDDVNLNPIPGIKGDVDPNSVVDSAR
ncbi:hypothetical protein BDV12DRAFT_189151 [Aspergillus spectabilis]